MRNLQNVLVTGGSGFIGSNFIRYLFGQPDFNGRIINLDALTASVNADSLNDVETKYGNTRYYHIRGNICNKELTGSIFSRYNVDTVVNFAAETPCKDKPSLPGLMMNTNINGTLSLLDTAKKFWEDKDRVLFHHVSTGDAPPDDKAESKDALGNHYSYLKSKASSNNVVSEYFKSYGIPVTISNSVNNFGPYQYPDKPVPGIIFSMKEGKTVKVTDGSHLGRMIYVDDHCSALWTILRKGKPGERYNIAGDIAPENSLVINMLCDKMGEYMNKSGIHYRKFVTHVRENSTADISSVTGSGKIKSELGWKESVGLGKGLELTVKWYHENSGWINRVRV